MMKQSHLILAVAVLFLISFAGCNSSKKEAPAPASQAGISLSGNVAETMNSGGYTYVSLENNGSRIWIAMPETKVKVGQAVTCKPGMEMKNFKSKTLNRTFESIIFSEGLL